MTTEKLDAILRLPEVKKVSGMSRAAIYRRMAAGAFPQCVDLGGSSVGWLESELQAWIQQLAAARKQAA